jgi:Amt family ammonium transporter
MVVMLVYPVVAHWMWSTTGWLSPWRTPQTAYKQNYLYFAGSGAYDFAGDAAVHMVSSLPQPSLTSISCCAGVW